MYAYVLKKMISWNVCLKVFVLNKGKHIELYTIEVMKVYEKIILVDKKELNVKYIGKMGRPPKTNLF